MLEAQAALVSKILTGGFLVSGTSSEGGNQAISRRMAMSPKTQIKPIQEAAEPVCPICESAVVKRQARRDTM
jgi:hypothetical protein